MYEETEATFCITTTNQVPYPIRRLLDATIYYTLNAFSVVNNVVDTAGKYEPGKGKRPMPLELALIYVLDSLLVKDIKLSVSIDGPINFLIGIGIFLVEDTVYPSIEFTFWGLNKHLIFQVLDGIINSIARMN